MVPGVRRPDPGDAAVLHAARLPLREAEPPAGGQVAHAGVGTAHRRGRFVEQCSVWPLPFGTSHAGWMRIWSKQASQIHPPPPAVMCDPNTSHLVILPPLCCCPCYWRLGPSFLPPKNFIPLCGGSQIAEKALHQVVWAWVQSKNLGMHIFLFVKMMKWGFCIFLPPPPSSSFLPVGLGSCPLVFLKRSLHHDPLN